MRQNARKIHVDCDPFDEEEWTRGERGGESPGDAPKTRTLAVDRVTLRTEGRFRCRHAHRDLTFYASEEDGIRDVEAALTAKHAWCATLGVRFPCSADSIKAAYRRLTMASHPDAGGDPAEFRAVEQAYREALAYFAPIDECDSPPRTRMIGSRDDYQSGEAAAEPFGWAGIPRYPWRVDHATPCPSSPRPPSPRCLQ